MSARPATNPARDRRPTVQCAPGLPPGGGRLRPYVAGPSDEAPPVGKGQSRTQSNSGGDGPDKEQRALPLESRGAAQAVAPGGASRAEQRTTARAQSCETPGPQSWGEDEAVRCRFAFP